MISELGHFALTLAFAVALFQVVVPLVGAGRGWSDWMRASVPAALMQFLLTGFAFAALTHAFVVLYEEPTLERRFGESYRRYRGSVNRWIPRAPR